MDENKRKLIHFFKNQYHAVGRRAIPTSDVAALHALNYGTAVLEGTRAFPDRTVRYRYNILNPQGRIDRLFRSMQQLDIVAPDVEDFNPVLFREEVLTGPANQTSIEERIRNTYMHDFPYTPKQVLQFTKDLLWMNLHGGAIGQGDEVYIRHIAGKAGGGLGVSSYKNHPLLTIQMLSLDNYLKGGDVLVWPEPVDDLDRRHKLAKNYAVASKIKNRTNVYGYDEALLLYTYDYVPCLGEGTGMNLFARMIDGVILTPPLKDADGEYPILPGKTRELIMQMSRIMGEAVVEDHIPLESLQRNRVSSLMLVGSAVGTHNLHSVTYEAGDHKVMVPLELDPHFQALHECYDRLVHNQNTGYSDLEEAKQDLLVPVNPYEQRADLFEKLSTALTVGGVDA